MSFLKILDAIDKLSVMELAELIKGIENKYGVSAASPVAAVAAMPMAGGASVATEEKNEFKVTLKDGGSDKIKVINQGNVETNLEFYGQDLESGENRINVSNLELSFDDKLSKLDYRPNLIDFNLTTGLDANKELLLKLNLPLSTVPSLYAGNINLVGVAK